MPKSKKISRFKITKAKIEDARNARREGVPLTRIHAVMKVSRPTFYRWLELGEEMDEKQVQRSVMSADQKLCVDLFYALEEGSIEGELEDLRIIADASILNYKAAEVRLKMRNKDYNVDKQKAEQSEELEEEASEEFNNISK